MKITSTKIPETPPPPREGGLEARIVLIYLILGSLWILASDHWVNHYIAGRQEAALAQSLKGVDFVMTTGVLLFFALRRAYGGWRLAEERRGLVAAEAQKKLRLLSGHIQNLREEERTWIAREIHDELGQLLTGIKMQVRLIENRLASRDDRSLNPDIDMLVEVSLLVDNTIASVQNISAGLRPGALDNLGLGSALQEEAGQFSQRTGISCALSVEDLPEVLPDDVSITVFRIFQETLTNVARHADAHRIDASISAADNLLRLEIHDDGKGIEMAAIENPTSLGLVGMLERAVTVGGKLVFRRNAEKGTDVILEVPLPAL